jgi:hypothetical protein
MSLAIEDSSLDETLRSIRSVPGANRALRVLEKAGCPLTPVVAALHYYCSPIPKVPGKKIDVGFRDFKATIARVLGISCRLKTDADELNNILSQLARTRGPDVHLKLPSEMRDAADLLEKLVAPYMGKGKRLAISGRNPHLIYLVHFVKEATHSEHYEEIASLVSAVQHDPEGKRTPTAASIAKKFQRFESSDPGESSALRGIAIDDLRELKQTQRKATSTSR